FAGNLGDGVQRTYATALRYDEASRMQQEQYGTQVPLYHKQHCNVRGQLYDIRLSTQSIQASEWDWNRGGIINYYAQNDINAQTNADRYNSGPENNGNILRAECWLPTDANGSYSGVSWSGSAYASYQENYAYDALNRLSSVTEYS